MQSLDLYRYERQRFGLPENDDDVHAITKPQDFEKLREELQKCDTPSVHTFSSWQKILT